MMADKDGSGNLFSADQLRLPEVGEVASPPKREPTKRRKWKEYFVSGPVWWHKKAARVHNRAAAYVGFILWRHTRMDAGKNDGWVQVKTSELAEYGFDRKIKHRAIKALREAGLIEVRNDGQHTIECRIDYQHDPDGTEWSC